MKKIGKVTKFNGKYGEITTTEEAIDFSQKDISNNIPIHEGNIVEFRVETKFPNIKIARNIKPIDLSNSENDNN